MHIYHLFQTSIIPRGLILTWILASFVAFMQTSRASAAEVEVKIDSLVDGSSANIQAGFDPPEQAAVWLVSPCNGNIVAIRVFWKSLTGGALQSVEDNITIHEAGTFPLPGSPLEFLGAPVMEDGFLNEFRFLDENQTIPLVVPIAENQQFAVSFQFFNDPNEAVGPSLVSDLNGCQAGKNAINAAGLGWISACDLGVSGDFMIRAMIDCEEEPGACCLGNGLCSENVSNTDCAQAGGAFQGAGVLCENVNCPQPEGACCFEAGCLDDFTLADCEGVNGVWSGADSTCGSTVCFAEGACCFLDGSCLDDQPIADCELAGGTFQGDSTSCEFVSCPQPDGACCFDNGNCLILSQSSCTIAAGIWGGSFTDCEDGDESGTADICEGGCIEPASGDVNDDQSVDGRDIGAFVEAMVGTPSQQQLCAGDFDESGDLGMGDVSGMVSAVLTGA